MLYDLLRDKNHLPLCKYDGAAAELEFNDGRNGTSLFYPTSESEALIAVKAVHVQSYKTKSIMV